MRGVGTDATDLFNEVHAWVNYESMLSKCLVGKLVRSLEGGTSKKAPVTAAMAPPAKKSECFLLSLSHLRTNQMFDVCLEVQLGRIYIGFNFCKKKQLKNK